MARRRRRRHLGDLPRSPGKVHAASQRAGLRGTRKFKIEVQVYRFRGGYDSMACIPKGSMHQLGPAASPWKYARRALRCGHGHAATPSGAVRAALKTLSTRG